MSELGPLHGAVMNWVIVLNISGLFLFNFYSEGLSWEVYKYFKTRWNRPQKHQVWKSIGVPLHDCQWTIRRVDGSSRVVVEVKCGLGHQLQTYNMAEWRHKVVTSRLFLYKEVTGAGF